MITQERVLELYDSANPVKDAESMMAELGAASYLATLEQRSSEMTRLDTTTKDETIVKRPPAVWMVAAIIVLVFGLAAIFVSQGTDETPPATDPIPTTVVESVREGIPVYVGMGSGQFVAARSSVPFAFTVGEGWAGRWSD